MSSIPSSFGSFSSVAHTLQSSACALAKTVSLLASSLFATRAPALAHFIEGHPYLAGGAILLTGCVVLKWITHYFVKILMIAVGVAFLPTSLPLGAGIIALSFLF